MMIVHVQTNSWSKLLTFILSPKTDWSALNARVTLRVPVINLVSGPRFDLMVWTRPDN